MKMVVTDDRMVSWPPEAQVVVRALLNQAAELKRRIAELEAWLNRNASNSSLVPSSTAWMVLLPHAVIWRKLSIGTQSEGGIRFVERMLTVIETSRRHGINPFE